MAELSTREIEILGLVVQSLSYKEIAHRVGLTEGAVKQYMHRIFAKLHFRNRTEVAVWLTRLKQNATH